MSSLKLESIKLSFIVRGFILNVKSLVVVDFFPFFYNKLLGLLSSNTFLVDFYKFCFNVQVNHEYNTNC